ncbi:MAG: phosphotransferase enzyme family protein [Pseudomonadales bacterium]
MKDFYQCTPEEQAQRLAGLAHAALSRWELVDASVKMIKHRENAVFRVTSAEQSYALRIHRANYHTDQELRSELQWIEAINSEALRTPQVIPTVDGAAFIHVQVDEVPEPRQVDLLEWFEGQPIASVEEGVEVTDVYSTYSEVGRLMALTHKHSEAWTEPAGFARHAWDEQGILGDEPFWGRYWELAALSDEQRRRLQKAKVKALEELKTFGKNRDRYGLIHADFVPENLLRSDSGICLIDFDDAGYGWHLFDIATSLFFLLGEPYFDEASRALLAGYRQSRPLPDEHLSHLPMFFLLRGTTYLGWAHTRQETETAQSITPMIVAAVDELAQDYLQQE